MVDTTLHNNNFSKAKYLSKFVLCLLLAFSVGACGMIGIGSKKKSANKVDISKARKGKLESNLGVDELRTLAKPLNPNKKTISTSGINSAQGSTLSIQPKGLLFDEPLRDADDRIDRLEGAVQNIQDDLDKVTPAIQRLVAIEDDIKELLSQLKTLVDEEPVIEQSRAIASGKPTQISKPIVEQQTKPRAKKASKESSVSSPNIRVADHSGKTRLVFETNKKGSYVVSFDADEKLLAIETEFDLSRTIPDKIKQKSNYVVEADFTKSVENGGILALSLKDIRSVTKGTYIAPNKDNPNHRFFIDLIK